MRARQVAADDSGAPPEIVHVARTSRERFRGRRWATTIPVMLLLIILGGCAGGPVAPSYSSASAGPPAAPAPAPRIEVAQALRMGDALRADGDPVGAAVFYRRAHDLEPDDLAPLLGMANAAAATGQHDAAAALFRQVLARDPGNAAARLGYGRTLLAMHQPATARAELRAALDADPADPRAALALGVAAELDGDPEAARAVYRDGLRHNPNHVLLRNNLALSLMIAGDTDQAIDILDQLAQTLDGGARVRQNLALANALAGHDDQARAIAAQDLRGAALDARLSFFQQLRSLDGPRLAEAVMSLRAPHALASVSTDHFSLTAPAPVFAELHTTHLASPEAVAVDERPRLPMTADVPPASVVAPVH